MTRTFFTYLLHVKSRKSSSPLTKCFIHMYVHILVERVSASIVVHNESDRIWMLTGRSHKVFRKRMRIFCEGSSRISPFHGRFVHGRALSRASHLYYSGKERADAWKSTSFARLSSSRSPIWLRELIRNIVNSSSLSPFTSWNRIGFFCLRRDARALFFVSIRTTSSRSLLSPSRENE